MNPTVTLTGYLGKDPQRRDTRSRTYTKTEIRHDRFSFQHRGRTLYDADDVLEQRAEYDVTTTPRGYAVLSLATLERQDGRWATKWHRVVAWNTDHEHFGIHRLGKGDKVRITGRETTFIAADGTTVDQVELIGFQLLKRKAPQPSDRTPAASSRQPETPTAHAHFVSRDGRRVPLTGAPLLNAATA